MFRLLWLIVIGALAGWIAGLLVRGRGFGIGVDIIVGILGSILGGWLLFDVLGLYGMAALGGLVARLIAAIIGALLLIVIIKALKKSDTRPPRIPLSRRHNFWGYALHPPPRMLSSSPVTADTHAPGGRATDHRPSKLFVSEDLHLN